MHVEELHQVQQLLHLRQQQLPHHQPDVDLPNGLMTNGVMMKITTQAAILMVELAVTITLADGLPIVKYI